MGVPPLRSEAVRLGCLASGRADAVQQTGMVMFHSGAVDIDYVLAMHEREKAVSTFIGEGVAIPHGTEAGRVHVRRTALSVLQFPDGVDWDGNEVKVCVGIASRDDERVPVLEALTRVLEVPERAAALRSATSVDDVLRLLEPDHDEEKKEG